MNYLEGDIFSKIICFKKETLSSWTIGWSLAHISIISWISRIWKWTDLDKQINGHVMKRTKTFWQTLTNWTIWSLSRGIKTFSNRYWTYCPMNLDFFFIILNWKLALLSQFHKETYALCWTNEGSESCGIGQQKYSGPLFPSSHSSRSQKEAVCTL